MLLTTTSNIEGRKIRNYLGIVTGDTILGVNILKDVFAGIRDIVGGRSEAYEQELQNARRTALQELEQRAGELGANAVVGVKLDYEILGHTNGMLMVAASGTAVVTD